MSKFLRYSLSLILAFVANITFAQTVFDFDNNYKALFPNLAGVSSNDSHDGDFTEATTCTVDGISITISAKDEGASSDNRIWTSSARLRMYSGTLTVQAPANKNITSIAIAQKKWNANNTVDNGTLDAKGNWTGSANKVVYTIAGNTQIKTITVTLDGAETPDQPETPTTPTCENIAAFKALTSGTTATLQLTNAQVVYKNVYTTKNGNTNTEYYVRDASGAIQFFNTGLELEVNQVLNGTVEVKYSPYNEMPEAAKTANTSADKLTITDGTATVPTKVKVADLADAKYLCDLVTIENANLNSEEDGDYSNIYAVDGDSKVMVYDKFKTGVNIPTDNDKAYDITGILVTAKLSGNIVKEFAPTTEPTISTSTGLTNLDAEVAAKNAPVYNLAGQKVSKAYKGVVIKAGKKFLQK